VKHWLAKAHIAKLNELTESEDSELTSTTVDATALAIAGASVSSLDVKGRTMSWEAHERDHQFGGNDSINIGQSPSLRNESNASIIMMSAMRPCLAKIIQKVRISRYFESPETDHHRAEIACCTDYAATWLLKRVD